jgi:tetratricopeptide (TPR) repeat protein
MMPSLDQLCSTARRAVQAKDWRVVQTCAAEILRRDAGSAEGHFLAGLAEKAAQRLVKAAEAFTRALELDPGRYDAAIELADDCARSFRRAEARTLLEKYESSLGNSPRYLNLAGLTWSMLGLHERAWPLYRRANELQPGMPLFEANLAACSVYLGKVDEARALYLKLLERNPAHQRNHYHLSRLARARDSAHVEQMQAVLRATGLPPEKNIFLHYALGKELEDLEQWDEAFHHYQAAGDAATSVSHYDVAADVALIDRIIEVCDASWLAAGPTEVPTAVTGKTPIFIVGLPRTGTTLTERILSSHSQVESIGETEFLQMVLRQVSGVPGVEGMTPAMLAAAAQQDIGRVADGYLNAVHYRLGERPFFIEKWPENILYLGFIAKAYPHARLLHLRRHPMDTCFAMYKQSFFRYAYTLENVGNYYVAYDRLARHWRALLGGRFVEVEYEALVRDQEGQTRRLLEQLQLDFEPACLEFDRNEAASATASSVQVREKIHTRSVQRWQQFERHLEPLRRILEDAGIAID